MRIASRHMPRITARPLGLAGGLFVLCLAAAVLGFALLRPQAFLVVSAGVAALLVLARLHERREARRLAVLAAQRPGQSICEFARDFDTRAVDTWLIRATYEQLQDQLKPRHPAFPIRADDRLKEDLGLDDEDLDLDLAADISHRTGRSFEGSRRNPYFGQVRTVRELVLFFQHQPLEQAR